MIERTLRCTSLGCGAKVRVELTPEQKFRFDDAMRSGIERGRWEKYRELRRELEVLCFRCEAHAEQGVKT